MNERRKVWDPKKRRWIEELDFSKCPKHNIRIPGGGTCPECEKEKRNR